MSIEYGRPAILGPSHFENPLLGPDGDIQSAFGQVIRRQEPGQPYGEVRVRERVWTDEAIPIEASEITEELILISGMVDLDLPRSTQKFRQYFIDLARGYNALGGSPALLFLERDMDQTVRYSQLHPTEGVTPDKLATVEAVGKFCGLHAPLDEEGQMERINSEVLPPVLDNFDSLYNFMGTLIYFSRALPKELMGNDTTINTRLSQFMEAYTERLGTFSTDEQVEWIKGQRGFDRGLQPFNMMFARAINGKLKQKQLAWEDRQLIQYAAAPFTAAFLAEGGGDDVLDFDKVRTFVEHCRTKAKADIPGNYKTSAYWAAALDATYIICDWHNQYLSDRKRDVNQPLATRIRNMRGVGLEPIADSMVYVYSLYMNGLKQHAAEASA